MGIASRRWLARQGSVRGRKKVGENPTDRGKNGTKKSLLVDAEGGPLGVVIEGAKVPELQGSKLDVGMAMT